MSAWESNDLYYQYVYRWSRTVHDPVHQNWRLANVIQRRLPGMREENDPMLDPWVCESAEADNVALMLSEPTSFEPGEGREPFRDENGVPLIPHFSHPHITFVGYEGRWHGVKIEIYMDRVIVTLSPWADLPSQDEYLDTEIANALRTVRQRTGIEALEFELREMGLAVSEVEGELSHIRI